MWSAYLLTDLAVAQASPAGARSALRSVEEALAVAAATGGDFYTAEALRVRGELRWEDGDPAGWTTCGTRSRRPAARGRPRSGCARWCRCRPRRRSTAPAKVAVLGGGMAGLTAAWALSRGAAT